MSTTTSTEPSTLLLQMYQMAHNELLTRIQQRDQYYICILCSVVALLASVLGIESTQHIKIALFIFSCCVFILMIFLTSLVWSSCSIYSKLIDHIRSIEETISHTDDGAIADSLYLWQHYIDNIKPNHILYSFIRAKFIFLFFDVLAAVFIVFELHLFFLM